MNIAYFIVCLLILAVASYMDIKDGKIQNLVFYPALAMGLTVPFVAGFWEFLLRLALVVLVFFVYDGFVGGGDAKLIMMLIMLGSPIKAFIAIILGTIGVLIYSYVTNPSETKTSVMNGIVALRTFNPGMVKGKGNTIIFAPFLAVGFIAATIIRGF